MEQSKFYQIKNVTEHEYTLVGCDGSVITRPIRDIDKSASAFTIQDAKNGNILASNRGDIIIVRRVHKNQPFAYCGINNDEFMVSDSKEFWHEAYYHPATKEQRDLLFQKMHEVGYEWDAEKKELKTYASETMNEKDAIDNGFTEMMLKEQKPIEWSDEDEEISAAIIKRIMGESNALSVSLSSAIGWIRKVKDRVIPQPKEWSEEDYDLSSILQGYVPDIMYKHGMKEIECGAIVETAYHFYALGVQSKQEWSEDDEQYLLVCKNALAKYQTTDKWDAHIISHWLENKLKSLRPQKNNWERVTKEIYFKEPVLVRRKDKSDSWEGYRVCSNYTLNPQTDERYILIKDINN